MYINEHLQNVPIVCINLKTRKDKRKWMINQCKRLQIDFNFYQANLNKNPKRGCLDSHLTVIRTAIAKGHKTLLVLEDDAKFLKPLRDNIPLPPANWDMLYLGGTVKSIYEQTPDNPWVRMSCWTTHAYLINLQNEALIKDIMDAVNHPEEIDSYYIKYIHSKYNTYMLNPMLVIQKEGYSDIEKTNVNYDFMQSSLTGLRKPLHDIVNGQYTLKLPPIPDEDLPYVSIITPTFERRAIFSIALWNFAGFYYPANKLEWIIIDDTIDENKSIKDMLPINDKRIKYYYFKVDNGQRMTIAKKRNLGVERASHDIIVHMDDDDFYPGESILARVKTLIKYTPNGVECVGCSKIGVYDLFNNVSSLSTDGELSLSEASMAYYKKFWKERGFNEIDEKGEYRSFIYDRFQKIMDIPYSFVIIAISHNTNFTEKKRQLTANAGTNKEQNFYDTWNPDIQTFITDLKTHVQKRMAVEESYKDFVL